MGFVVVPPAGTIRLADYQSFPITEFRIVAGGFSIEAEAIAQVEIPGGEYPWILFGEDGVAVAQRATEPLLIGKVWRGDTVKLSIRIEH